MLDDWTTTPDVSLARPPSRWPRVAAVLSAIALWLWIVFAGGALILLGVAVPVEARLRSAAASQGTIDATLTALALAWIGASLVFALALARRLRGRVLALAHGAGLVLCAVVFALFLNAAAGTVTRLRAGADRFVFGAYPGTAQFRALKRDGFTGVVSLLSDIVPFEAVLVARERAAARSAGLAFVHVPMLPWVVSNAAALDSLRSLARRRPGRWYVHCYLGRHRIELARFAMLEAVGTTTLPRIELPDSLERGAVVRLESSVALGPLPTRDEWFTWIVPSGTRRVIAMLDPASRADAPWIAEERQQAADAGINLIVIPVRVRADARTVADSVRAGERCYVHGFVTDERVGWVLEALGRGNR